MNMFLALAWLLLGVTLLGWQELTGAAVGYFSIGGVRISYGWVMFVFVLYNLRRWQEVRTARIRFRHQQLELAVQHRLARERRAEPELPDPNFDFSNQPAPPRTDVTDTPAG